MTGRTHDLAAFTLLNLIFISIPTPTMTVATVVAGLGGCFIGGLFPDIDQPTADLYRRLPAGNVFGRMIAPVLGSHRFISHSFLGGFAIGYVMNKFLEKVGTIVLVDMHVVWWTFMIGFVSHIFMDMLTKEGVPLLFPFGWRFGIPPIAKFRVKTGGLWEKGIIFPALMILNGYIVYQYHEVFLSFFKQYIH